CSAPSMEAVVDPGAGLGSLHPENEGALCWDRRGPRIWARRVARRTGSWPDVNASALKAHTFWIRRDAASEISGGITGLCSRMTRVALVTARCRAGQHPPKPDSNHSARRK